MAVAPAPAPGPAGAAAPAGRGTRTAQAAAAAAAAAEAAAPTIVTVSMMDFVVPTIPEVTIDNVERKMPHPTLARINGEPDYALMSIVREELTRNAIASKSTFGGGEHGHYGSITDPATYVIDAGVQWTVPAGGGLYPTFAAGMTDAQKKMEVARFVVEQTNIKQATTTEEVLKNQFLEAVPEDYYLELNV